MTPLALALALPLAQDDPGVYLWATGSTEKVQDSHRSELPHLGVWDADAVTARLRGVRGEHVPFQLVVTADRVELARRGLDDAEGTGVGDRRGERGAGDPAHRCLHDRDVHPEQARHAVVEVHVVPPRPPPAGRA